MTKDLRYPIGKFVVPEEVSTEEIIAWKNDIRTFATAMKKAMEKLPIPSFLWTYRPGGWTIQEVVHHCGDSHMNALVRFKLALTEDHPTIKPYTEAAWATLADSQTGDIQEGLLFLELLHKRWMKVLDAMVETDWARTYVHPEHGRVFRLDQVLANYSWHCRHHLAHVQQAIAEGGYGR